MIPVVEQAHFAIAVLRAEQERRHRRDVRAVNPTSGGTIDRVNPPTREQAAAWWAGLTDEQRRLWGQRVRDAHRNPGLTVSHNAMPVWARELRAENNHLNP